MKIKKRFAFTMAEIMIIFLIIGLVAMAIFQVSKHSKDKATQYLYYSAFQHLKTIGSEVYVASSDKMLPQTDTNLCNSIAKLVNTIGTVDCSRGTETEFIDTNTSMIWSNGMKYYNFRPKVEDCRTSTKSERYITSAQDFIDCIPQDGIGTSGKIYQLTANIDFSEVNYVPKTNFAGTLDGDFHIMESLTLEASSDLGLFASSSGATFKKIFLKNFQLNSSGAYSNVGALSALISNSTLDAIGITGGYISSRLNAGGLIGNSTGTVNISNTYSNINVFGGTAGGVAGSMSDNSHILNSYAIGAITLDDGGTGGGLAGSVNSISNSYATGNVTASSTNKRAILGGLVGTARGKVIKSFATGTVKAYSGHGLIGGLVGYSSGEISNSYATGGILFQRSENVNNDTNVGGLVGAGDTIVDSYAMGPVSALPSAFLAKYLNIGGLVGTLSSATITGSYSTGSVSYTAGTLINAGGFVGSVGSVGAMVNSFWDTQASGMSDGVGSGPSFGLLGLGTNAMKNPSSYPWTSSIWDFSNGQYPLLLDMPPYTWGTIIWDLSKYPAENPTFKIKKEEVDSDLYSITLDINGNMGKSKYDLDVFKFDVLHRLGLIVPALGSIAAESGRFLSVSVRYDDFSSGNRVVKWLAKNIGYRQAVCMVGTVPSADEYCKGKGLFVSVDGVTNSPAYVKHATCTTQANCEIVINKP